VIDIFQHAFDNDKNEMPLFQNDENNIELFAKEEYETYEDDFHDESSFDSDDEATSSDDDDTECEKEPQLDQSLLQIVQSLSPINEDAPRLSINTLRQHFQYIKKELENVYGKPVSRDTSLKVSKVSSYLKCCIGKGRCTAQERHRYFAITPFIINGTTLGVEQNTGSPNAVLTTYWQQPGIAYPLALGLTRFTSFLVYTPLSYVLMSWECVLRLASLVDSIRRPHNQNRPLFALVNDSHNLDRIRSKW
jgi:hypothetical protein